MNKKLQLTVFTALLVIFLTTFLQAQQINPLTEHKISSSKQALIKEYFEAIGGRESLNKIFDATFANLGETQPTIFSESIIEDTILSDSQKAEILKIVPEMTARWNKKFREGLNQEVDLTKLVEEIYYPLLDKFYTDGELKDLITFYKSPTGQKTVLIQPEMLKDAITKINTVLIPVMQKLIKKLTEEEINEQVKKTKQSN